MPKILRVPHTYLSSTDDRRTLGFVLLFVFRRNIFCSAAERESVPERPPDSFLSWLVTAEKRAAASLFARAADIQK